MELLCSTCTLKPNKKKNDSVLSAKHRMESFHSQNLEQSHSIFFQHFVGSIPVSVHTHISIDRDIDINIPVSGDGGAHISTD
jgi:hypothetical protein